MIYAANAIPSLCEAYAAAERYVRRRSQTFRLVASFLPPNKRQATWVTYAFFRRIDDLVDQERISLVDFRAWRRQAMRPAVEQSDPILAAWADVRERFTIDPKHIQDLLDGVEMDLSPRRYETLDELYEYCYRVASAAALLALPLVHLRSGVTLAEAEPYVAKMGIAVQLTDILCDVREDAEANRIYLPKSDLATFGLSYANVEARVFDDRFKRLMQRMVAVTRKLFVEAWPMLGYFSGLERLTTGLGVTIFRAYLDEIERLDFDVFTHRVDFTRLKKIGLLLTQWPAIAWPERANS